MSWEKDLIDRSIRKEDNMLYPIECTVCGVVFTPKHRSENSCSICQEYIIEMPNMRYEENNTTTKIVNNWDELTDSKHPTQTLMANDKVASTKGPSFHLIPTVALVELAKRFELGEERKGDKAWNATSKNQECLLDRTWLIERCSHIIHHTMKLRDQLAGLDADELPIDNASAIAWSGMFMICATDALAKQVKE